jgi:hypothetical protein
VVALTSPGSHARLLTPAAVRYAWNELSRRVGVTGEGAEGQPFESLGVSVHYGSLSDAPPGRRIVVTPAAQKDFDRLLTEPKSAVSWANAADVVPAGDTAPIDLPIPVLARGAAAEGGAPFAYMPDESTVVFNADIIGSTLFMLTRWEETAKPERDKHDRFPATASAAYQAGFLDRPIVDEYAVVLRLWLARLAPGAFFSPAQFSVQLTHDIDYVERFDTRWLAMRCLAGDLVKRRDLPAALATAKEIVGDPWVSEIYRLAKLSKRHNLKSAFYFMAARPEMPDVGYDVVQPKVRNCIKWLQDSGFETGFHPGYYTYRDWGRFDEERNRLGRVADIHGKGGRQHVLRFDVPTTWRLWERARFDYDSTLGFADHEGFRCGTCHPFRPFDVELQRVLDLWERPLIAMETTLRVYRSLSTDQAESSVRMLVDRCKRVDGCFVLLWHNTSLSGDWIEWGRLYERLAKWRYSLS